ncbi:PQQ-dependent sugar dehydrogenase [Tahibacter amnicola]|uniref:PQQ-dependent sugar dehydrogenase n=1 Tax=Tahibacter amnicola TaxID=2976241 RepID=A0ABY6BHR3_9GAMM|nr:PQQ-dependent sugar dehydrogenase [Tahibacter amnicola]UXI69419.1 PQQ-dependent sugar dehydrogenase [Tahibacter amnicola]
MSSLCRYGSLAAALVSAASATAAIPNDLALVPYASGLNTPVALANAGDGSGRLFAAEIGGRVRVIRNGVVLPAPLLDLSALVSTSSCGGECGLLGLAFAPDFATSRHVFTLHNDPQRNNVILRHRVPAGSDVADPDSRTAVMTIGNGSGQHNGGDLKFGPDGMLYISVGDAAGGGAPAQQLSSLRGKILRIDVRTLPYTIPAGNPFAADAPSANTRDEIWHYGLRNPWRMSFDRASGAFWVADVGGNGGAYEEISRAGAGVGGLNFGWNCFSGPQPMSCSIANHTPPVIAVQTATLGCAIVGGFVFQGPVAALKNTYFYGDFCTGAVWAANAANPATPQFLFANTAPVTTFGEDEAGWLYVAEHAPNARVLRIASDQIFNDHFGP